MQKTPSIQRTLTASTAGPRFSASIFIWHTGAAAVCRRECPYHNVFGPYRPGTEDAKSARCAIPQNRSRAIAVASNFSRSSAEPHVPFITNASRERFRLMRSDVVDRLNTSRRNGDHRRARRFHSQISAKVLHRLIYQADKVPRRGRTISASARRSWAPSEPLRKGLESDLCVDRKARTSRRLIRMIGAWLQSLMGRPPTGARGELVIVALNRR